MQMALNFLLLHIHTQQQLLNLLTMLERFYIIEVILRVENYDF